MPHNRCAERTGLSVVVPSASRGPTLHVLLIALLQQEALRVPGSEIIVSHATFDSLNEAPNMSPRVLAACASCDVRRIVHVDSVRINDALGCAHRYVVASKHARNNVLLHLDDDLLPKAALLQALVQSVCAEPGFPEYARTSRPNPFRSAPLRPSFYGTTPRLCSKDGYRFYSRRYTLSQRGKWVLQKPYYVLTNVASMSRALNAEFVAVLNQSYASLMRVTGGEGCDLVFNHFARGAGSTPTALRGHLHTWSVENIRRPKHLQAAAELSIPLTVESRAKRPPQRRRASSTAGTRVGRTTTLGGGRFALASEGAPSARRSSAVQRTRQGSSGPAAIGAHSPPAPISASCKLTQRNTGGIRGS